MPAQRALARLLSLVLCGLAAADEYAHRFTEAEVVNLWVNKVGPYHNPQETYVYYSLPFCSSKPVTELEHRWDYLGEVLEGNDLISSGLAIQFRAPVRDHSKICSMTLTDDTVQQLQYAVRNHYWCLAARRPLPDHTCFSLQTLCRRSHAGISCTWTTCRSGAWLVSSRQQTWTRGVSSRGRHLCTPTSASR